jgi:hypothetical protein
VVNLITVLLIILFVSYCAWRENQWGKERKDLYNRLMAKDLAEYREDSKAIPPPKAPNNKFVTMLRKQNSPSKGGD